MLKRRFSLTTIDVLALLAGLVVLAGLNLWQLVGSDGQEPAAVSVIRPPQAQRMSDEMQLRYDRWAKGTRGVSVFARGETAFGWTKDFLDEDTAKADAMAWCANEGQDCRVVEVRNELSVVQGLDMPVTERISAMFVRFQMTPGPVAFAVSGNGAHAAQKGETAEQAKVNALAACMKVAVKDREAFLPPLSCRIVAQR
ncbi:hypothetical protein [Tateyamaria sp.]|uniref:hypothetical protein n=1 Tax=Tateyamaria sp. TaxID=1929288 RepID=UPI00329B5D32